MGQIYWKSAFASRNYQINLKGISGRMGSMAKASQNVACKAITLQYTLNFITGFTVITACQLGEKYSAGVAIKK